MATELFQNQFFLVLQFIFGGDIIPVAANGANHAEFGCCNLLGHMKLYYIQRGNQRQEGREE